MTGPELQGRVVRRVEQHYSEVVSALRKAGMDPARSHEIALADALRLLSESLEELRRRGLFPWPVGEIEPGRDSLAGEGRS